VVVEVEFVSWRRKAVVENLQGGGELEIRSPEKERNCCRWIDLIVKQLVGMRRRQARQVIRVFIERKQHKIMKKHFLVPHFLKGFYPFSYY